MKKAILIPALLLALVSLTAGNLKAQDATFADFLAQFPSTELPYTFSVESLQSQLETPKAPAAKAKRLAWEYYQFLPELERSAAHSNMPVYPEPVAKFETESYYAVLYNLARGFSKGVKTYSLTVFDKNGNYIGTNFVAGCNAEKITVATISTELQAQITAYGVNWAFEYSAADRSKNSVVSLTEISTVTLDLSIAGNPDELDWSAVGNQHDANIAADAK